MLLLAQHGLLCWTCSKRTEVFRHLDEAMVWFAAPLNGLLNGTLGSLVLLRPPVCLL